MFSVLFKEIKAGELRRMAFFGYGFFLMLTPLIFMLVIVLSIGAGEHLIGGDLAQVQEKLSGWFGGPATIIIIAFMVAALFAQFNIMAKRIRHMGLSGWWGVLGIIVVNLVVTGIAGEDVGNIVGLGFALALLFIPGASFDRSRL